MRKHVMLVLFIIFLFINVEPNAKTVRAQCNFCTKTKTVISDKALPFLKHLQHVHFDGYGKSQSKT